MSAELKKITDTPSLFERDDKIQLPSVDIISASAGSGKTFTMAMRLTQFLLSDKIRTNDLGHILAITFTNLAAKELKERLILTLKKLALLDQDTLKFFTPLISLNERQIPGKAEALLEIIFSRYHDLQIRTIDSFFSKVFRSGAHEFGFYQDCDITFNNHLILDRAFDEFSRDLSANTPLKEQLIYLTGLISEGAASSDSFLWNPFSKIKRELIPLFVTISRLSKELDQTDRTGLVIEKKVTLRSKAREFMALLIESGLDVNENLKKELIDIADGNSDPSKPKIKTKAINASGKKNPRYQEFEPAIRQMLGEYNLARMEYLLAEAQNFYYPYTVAYRLLQEHVLKIQHELGMTTLNQVHERITRQLIAGADINPLYEKLGDTLYHFMIDEFQDTSPVHWNNLKTLIGNALSAKDHPYLGGSLFIVGDTKQSIYSFNGADWNILSGLIREADRKMKTFPSVSSYRIGELGTNYRSGQAIVDFNKTLFQETIPGVDEYKTAVSASGLNSYHQEPEKKHKGQGYAEVRLHEDATQYEQILLDIVNDLRSRHVALNDIAVLTRKNSEVIAISEFLKANRYPCISYSNLDIRQQTLTAEILSLLKFLDSPIDNLSFANFILGRMFNANLQTVGMNGDWPEFILRHRGEVLYKAFTDKHPDLWERYFSQLFAQTGYLPLYDLISEIFKTFRVFTTFAGETATLTKILETAKAFEQDKRSSIKEYLSVSLDENNDAWNIRVSRDIDAIRVLTIHKSKGLDFGYVILLIRQGIDTTHPKPYAVEFEHHAELIKLNSTLSERSGEFSDFTGSIDHDFHFLFERYEQEKLIKTVEKLNTLYVGCTRPKHELYVIGVKTKLFQSKDSLNYLRTGKTVFGHKHYPEKPKSSPAAEPLFHFNPESNIRPNQTVHKLTNAERHRGDNMHFVLSKIHYLENDVSRQIRKIITSNVEPFEPGLTDKDIALLAEFLLIPALKPYFDFKANRVVQNEKEFTDAEGASSRIDRLVIDDDCVTIIDYKTGHTEDTEKYSKQISAYKFLIQSMYPGRTVKGILAFIDIKTIRTVL